jgi:hypothetical protein
MYNYFVADTNARERHIALRDPAGRFHVARTALPMPLIGDELGGALPGPGFVALHDAQGREHLVTFDLINCGQQAALERLHASFGP